MTNFFLLQFANSVLNTLLLLLLISVFLIILQRNPVYAVFAFIFTALLVFLLLLLIKAEFFALLILIIYTGVITVLFLFVVIMYNLQEIHLHISNIFLNPFLLLVVSKLYWLNTVFVKGCIDMIVVCILHDMETYYRHNAWTLDVVQLTILYNEHAFLFFFCGLLLFVALVGSIVITYPFFKYQK